MGKRHHEGHSKKKSKHRQSEKRLPKIKESPPPMIVATSTSQEEIVFDINDETDCVEVEITEENQMNLMQPLPLKQSPQSKKSAQMSAASNSSTPTNSGGLNNNNKLKNKKRRDSGTSSEEERWLTAIESGKLDDVDDELKKMKDPKLMTQRQRAIYERGIDKEPTEPPMMDMLMSLPTGYREKAQTVEDDQKRILKIQKRKQLADEKREKDKQKTMDRLLNKKESSKQRAAARSKAAAAATKATVPMISYRNTVSGAYIQLPPGVPFPLKTQKPREAPKRQLCGIVGCNQPKSYNCSKTNIPLCSLACYRKNVQSLRQIMC